MTWLVCLLGLAVPAAPPQALVRDAPGIGLELRVDAQIERRGGGSEELRLEDGGVLRSGDAVRFRYRVRRDAYVYLLVYGSSGTATLIDPISGAPEEARLAAGEERQVPADGSYLRLDETVGREVFVAVALPRPLDPVAPLLIRIEAGGADPEALTRALEAQGAAFATVAVRHLGREPLIGVGPSVARRVEAPPPPAEEPIAPRPPPPRQETAAPAAPTRLFPEDDPYQEPEVLGGVGSRIRALPVGGGVPPELPVASPGEPSSAEGTATAGGDAQGPGGAAPGASGGLLGKLGRLLGLGGGESPPPPVEPAPRPEPVARSYPLPGVEPEAAGGESAATGGLAETLPPPPVSEPVEPPPPPGPAAPPPGPLAGPQVTPAGSTQPAVSITPEPAPSPAATSLASPAAPEPPPIRVLEPRSPGRVEPPAAEALAPLTVARLAPAEQLEVPLPAGPAASVSAPSVEGLAAEEVRRQAELTAPLEPVAEAPASPRGEERGGGLLSVLGSLLGGGKRAPEAPRREEEELPAAEAVAPAIEPITPREPERIAGLALEREVLPRPRTVAPLAEAAPLPVVENARAPGEEAQAGRAPAAAREASAERGRGGWISSLLGGLLGRREEGEPERGPAPGGAAGKDGSAAREAAPRPVVADGGAPTVASASPSPSPPPAARPPGATRAEAAAGPRAQPAAAQGGGGVLSGTGSKIAALLAGEKVPPEPASSLPPEPARPLAAAEPASQPGSGEPPPVVRAPEPESVPAGATVSAPARAGAVEGLAEAGAAAGAPVARVEPDPVQLALVKEEAATPAMAPAASPAQALEPLARIDLRDPADVSRAVVMVSTARGAAAGALIDPRGYVLTVWHAVRGMGSAAVIFRAPDDALGDAERVVRARVVRVNRFADLALLLLETVPEDVTPLRLAKADAVASGGVLHVISQGRDGVWRHTVGKVNAVRPNSSWYSGQRLLHRATVLRGKVLDEPGNAGAALLSNDLELLALGAEDRLRNDRLTAVAVDTIRRFLAAPDGEGGALAGGG